MPSLGGGVRPGVDEPLVGHGRRQRLWLGHRRHDAIQRLLEPTCPRSSTCRMPKSRVQLQPLLIEVQPHAQEIVLGIAQVGDGRQQVECGGRAELGRRLGPAGPAGGGASDLPGFVHAAHGNCHRPPLNFQVLLVLPQQAQVLPQRLVDAVFKLDQRAAVRLVADQRLAVVVAFEQTGEGRIEPQPGRDACRWCC